MALGLTQSLREISIRNIQWGVKVASASGWETQYPPKITGEEGDKCSSCSAACNKSHSHPLLILGNSTHLAPLLVTIFGGTLQRGNRVLSVPIRCALSRILSTVHVLVQIKIIVNCLLFQPLCYCSIKPLTSLSATSLVLFHKA